MPHNVALITTIVAALGGALALGFLAARLKLPVLIGYLAAGIVICRRNSLRSASCC